MHRGRVGRLHTRPPVFGAANQFAKMSTRRIHLSDPRHFNRPFHPDVIHSREIGDGDTGLYGGRRKIHLTWWLKALGPAYSAGTL